MTVHDVSPTSTTPVLPEVAPEKPRGGLFNRFRKSSSAVLEIAEVQAEPESIAEAEILFGLEYDLDAYVDAWDAHSSVIETVLEDEESKEGLLRLLVNYSDSPPVRRYPKQKRRAINGVIKDYPRFVSIYAATGRYLAARKDVAHDPVVMPDGTMGISDAVRTGFSSRREAMGVLSFQDGILNQKNLHCNPDELKPVAARFIRLRDDARLTFEPIVKLEWAMSAKILERLQNEPGSASRLLDAFVSNAQSEASVERAFARFLANRYLLHVKRSELGQALAKVETSATSGELATEFLNEQLIDTNNMLGYFMNRSGMTQEEFMQSLVEDIANWPRDLSDDYQGFVNQKTQGYRGQLQRVVEQASFKKWMRPDPQLIHDEAERLFNILYGQSEAERSFPAETRQAVAPAHLVNKHEVSTSEKRAKPRTVTVLNRKNGGFTANRDTDVDSIIREQLGRKHEANEVFVRELKEAITRLQTNQFFRGVRSIAGGNSRIDIDGRTVRLYRANPARMSGLSTSRQSKELRIIFAVDGSQLHIAGIFTQHSDYEQFLLNL